MITIDRKTELKKQLLEACIRKQQSLIDDFKEHIKALFINEVLGNEEEYDHDELAQQSQSRREANLLNEALEFAQKEMELLRRLEAAEDQVHDRAELGAAVVTPKHTYFISASIEQFEVNGKPFIGISTDSPIFHSMKGKKKGESFIHKGQHYHIDDIY